MSHEREMTRTYTLKRRDEDGAFRVSSIGLMFGWRLRAPSPPTLRVHGTTFDTYLIEQDDEGYFVIDLAHFRSYLSNVELDHPRAVEYGRVEECLRYEQIMALDVYFRVPPDEMFGAVFTKNIKVDFVFPHSQDSPPAELEVEERYWNIKDTEREDMIVV